MSILPSHFYDQDTRTVAQALLGTYLVHRVQDKTFFCRIAETEAYIGSCDQACHAYQYRKTARTEAMFAPAGHSYVYAIYGLHYCLNLVTEPEGEPCAVLLRGGALCGGRDEMDAIAVNRFGVSYGQLTAYQRKNLLNGPGKLCKALLIDKTQNKLDLTRQELFVCESLTDIGYCDPILPKEKICVGKRIGIDYAKEAIDFPWRFWLEEM